VNKATQGILLEAAYAYGFDDMTPEQWHAEYAPKMVKALGVATTLRVDHKKKRVVLTLRPSEIKVIVPM
jgi:hypothetical protein